MAIEEYWESMCGTLESRGAVALIEWIHSAENDELRRKLFFQAQHDMSEKSWRGKNIDDYIRVSEGGIIEALRQSAAASDAELKARLTDTANIMSYNLSAQLADCWPEDDFRRGRSEFERGLKAAQDCLKWRRELKKGPGPFCIAHWAAGMHQLSLGHIDAAISNFAKSLEYAYEAAEAHGKSRDVTLESTYFVILAHGYYGLGLWASGEEGVGRKRFQDAIAAFEAQEASGDPDKAANAKTGLKQLRIVQQRYTSG
jgi:hypothetical protein